MHVLPPTFKLVLQQIRLLQKVESSPTFYNQICVCCEFYCPKANLVCSKGRY